MTLGRQIAFNKALAWLALFWERLWPALLPAAAIAGLFVALALLDLPTLLPAWLHFALLVGFALALLLALWRGARRFRLPDADEARRRLERDSGFAHRPLQALEDHLPAGADRASQRLWELHRRRLVERLGRLRVRLPRPNVPARDPWALRALVFLLLVIGGVVGGDDAPDRLWRALTPQIGGAPPPPPQFDAWINPPAYTGVAPIKLTAATPQPVPIPRGSTLLARLFGGRGDAVLALNGESTPFRRADAQNQEIETRIDGGERLSVTQGGEETAGWQISVAGDQPPTISMPHGPQVTARDVLRLPYHAQDDYGLTSVVAELRLDHGGEATVHDDRVVQLPLPLSPPGTREASDVSYHDLTPHPWAGLPVVLQLVARDGAKQEGRSKAFHLILPERTFTNPVARAIIEQRRILARQPERQNQVALALDAIASGPAAFDHDVVVFLALSTAAERLRLNVDPENRDAVSSLLWDTALRLEDGKLSLAERDLRAAQRALMEALSRNADDSEIQRLMDRLQQAMNRYLQAMAEQAMEQARKGGEPPQIDPNARVVQADELSRMLERARELSRMGARDAARQMLQQLQEMLENMRSGRVARMTPQQRQGNRAMRDLGNLMQQQQRLLDRTFRNLPRAGGQQGQVIPGDPNGPPTRGRAGEGQGQGQTPDQRGLRGLSQDQEGLRRQLGELMRRLGEGSGQIPGGLGRAERAMRDSREALGEGERGDAVTAQSQALDQLAEGLRELADRMQQQAGEGRGGQRGQNRPPTDPAGRPMTDGGMSTGGVEVPEQWEMRRAREILEELRRRSGERTRPTEERHYIDRLLQQF